MQQRLNRLPAEDPPPPSTKYVKPTFYPMAKGRAINPANKKGGKWRLRESECPRMNMIQRGSGYGLRHTCEDCGCRWERSDHSYIQTRVEDAWRPAPLDLRPPGAPLCPACKIDMVLKLDRTIKAKDGTFGLVVYGCPHYTRRIECDKCYPIPMHQIDQLQETIKHLRAQEFRDFIAPPGPTPRPAATSTGPQTPTADEDSGEDKEDQDETDANMGFEKVNVGTKTGTRSASSRPTRRSKGAEV